MPRQRKEIVWLGIDCRGLKWPFSDYCPLDFVPASKQGLLVMACSCEACGVRVNRGRSVLRQQMCAS